MKTTDSPDHSQSRREAVRQIGGWLIFGGLVGAETACGSRSFSRSVVTSQAACDCTGATGTATGLLTTDIPVEGVAWNSADSIFICHDSQGFYAMDSLCTHAGCDMGSRGGFSTTSLSGGFHCSCHGSSFDANGNVTGGPAPSPLPHYHLGIDSGNQLWIDAHVSLADPTCRCS